MTIWGLRLSVALAAAAAILAFSFTQTGGVHFKGLSLLAVTLSVIAMAATGAAWIKRRYPASQG